LPVSLAQIHLFLLCPFDLKAECIAFQMQVVMNKCFLLNPEKILVQIRLVIFEKNAPLILKNDVSYIVYCLSVIIRPTYAIRILFSLFFYLIFVILK